MAEKEQSREALLVLLQKIEELHTDDPTRKVLTEMRQRINELLPCHPATKQTKRILRHAPNSMMEKLEDKLRKSKLNQEFLEIFLPLLPRVEEHLLSGLVDTHALGSVSIIYLAMLLRTPSVAVSRQDVLKCTAYSESTCTAGVELLLRRLILCHGHIERDYDPQDCGAKPSFSIILPQACGEAAVDDKNRLFMDDIVRCRCREDGYAEPECQHPSDRLSLLLRKLLACILQQKPGEQLPIHGICEQANLSLFNYQQTTSIGYSLASAFPRAWGASYDPERYRFSYRQKVVPETVTEPPPPPPQTPPSP